MLSYRKVRKVNNPTAGPYAYKSGFKAEAFPKHNTFND